MESSYKAMLNCKIKERKECSKHAQLLQKEDRINRILAKMKGQQCTEEQMAEVRHQIFSLFQVQVTIYQSSRIINTLMFILN